MGVLDKKHLVGEDGQLRLQGIGGATAPVRVVSRHQGRALITPSYYHFFTMLEKYNPGTCTFFTRVGEMGFALHEMLSFGAIHGGPASTSLVLKNCTY